MIPNPLKSAAIARPDHIAVIDGDRSITYRELAKRAAKIAATLKGDRIALIGEPSIEWITTFHAIGWAGKTVVPLSHQAPRSLQDQQCAEAQVTTVVNVNVHLQVDVHVHELEEYFWPLNQPRAVFFTSGSTSGTPKPITLDTQQILFSTFGSTTRLGHALDDRWLACLPFHHVGGASILWRAAFLGITVIVERRFDPRITAQHLDDGRATLVSLVPEMFQRLLDARENKPFPSTLRAILLGGDRAPQSLIDRVKQIGAPLSLTWGMTECASQIATAEPGDYERLPPLPFARVENSADGTLKVKGPIAPEGRFTTKDAGEVTPDGSVKIHGRSDAVFISGGEKIDPSRVERVLESHPAIAAALVFGKKDERWGRRAEALVVPKNKIDSTELIAWCRTRLERAEVPAQIRFVDALPLGATGKPSRSEAEKRSEEQR